jgi:hypothetical protein
MNCNKFTLLASIAYFCCVSDQGIAQDSAATGVIRNQTAKPVAIYWADEQGANQNYFDAPIPPGGEAAFQSYPGTVWRAYHGNTFVSEYTATGQAGQVFQVGGPVTPGAAPPQPDVDLEESREEQTLMSSAVGKWQRLVLRKGTQVRPADDYIMSESSSSYFTLALDEYERDRDGQGVFRYSIRTLLYCDAGDVTVNETDDSVEIVMQFSESQGTGKSTVRLSGKMKKDDEGEFAVVGFSGNGSVYSNFMDRLEESLDGAEWYESLATLRWKAFVSDP